MWQHSQICCHGMPQAVVLRTKRDRGLSCRGATLRGPGEQHSYAKREKKHSHGFLTHPFLSRPQPPPNIHLQQSWAAAALTHHQSRCIRTVFTHHLRCFGRLLAPIWPTALFLSPSVCLQCLQLFLSCYAVTLGPHLVYSLRDFPWIPEPWQGQTVQILRVDGSSTQQWMFFYLLPL